MYLIVQSSRTNKIRKHNFFWLLLTSDEIIVRHVEENEHKDNQKHINVFQTDPVKLL